MIDVEVMNFQSIEHANLKINGFTALVGKSNIGKSALVRAIKYALTGATGTHFVRHGPNCARSIRDAKTCDCYCTVILKAEGFELVWEKGDKKNRYVLNGQECTVPNRGTPDFLEKPKLPKDFGQVKVGDCWNLLQISDQFDNTFLLNQSGITVADVISDVANLDCINDAVRLVDKDRREAASTRKIREQDLVGVVRELGSYEGLDKEVKKVDRVERLLSTVTESEDKLQKLSGYVDELRDLGFRVDQLQKAFGIPVPDSSTVVQSKQNLDKVDRFLGDVRGRTASIRDLMGVETIPETSPTPMVDRLSRQTQLDGWVKHLRGLQHHFGQAKIIEQVPDFDAQKLPSSLEAYSRLRLLHEKQHALEVSIRGLEDEIKTVGEEEKKLLVEQSKYKRCPTCQQYAFSDHIHDRSSP